MVIKFTCKKLQVGGKGKRAGLSSLHVNFHNKLDNVKSYFNNNNLQVGWEGKKASNQREGGLEKSPLPPHLKNCHFLSIILRFIKIECVSLRLKV